VQRTIFEPEHEALRETVKEFLARSVLPRWADFIAAHAFPRDMWIEAGKQGLLSLNIPEQYGGGGVTDWRFTVVVAEELARVSAALSSCMGIHSDVVAPYLVELTTPEQRDRWLPRFCTGELLTAIGMTEPSGGSDLANLKTTAVLDGDTYIVNGSKTFITNGFSADLVLVAARTDPTKRAKGITLLAIETGMEGFTRGRKLDKVGQDESDTAELFFSDVRVPVANVVGEVGQGFVHMMERLVQERIGAAVSNLAHARGILDETIEYVKDRHAFGQSVGSFQYNKFRVAELVTQADVTQAFIDQCVLAHCAGELTAVDAAKAKLWATEVQNRVLDRCLQLFGGYGYMAEYPIARAYTDARVQTIYGGTSEIMKTIIARDLTGLRA
jgi:alkylation response protein AidB-like acyl-CoA dehydrogenase